MSDSPYGETLLHPEDEQSLVPGLRGLVRTKNDAYLLENEALSAIMARELDRRDLGVLTLDELTDYLYVRDLHRDALKEIWTWAGEFRSRETNIGLDPRQVQPQLRNRLLDLRTQISTGLLMPYKAGLTAHARVVSVHPFKDCNGRISRMHADILFRFLDPRSLGYQWTGGKAYIDALRHEEHSGDISELEQVIQPVPTNDRS